MSHAEYVTRMAIVFMLVWGSALGLFRAHQLALTTKGTVSEVTIYLTLLVSGVCAGLAAIVLNA